MKVIKFVCILMAALFVALIVSVTLTMILFVITSNLSTGGNPPACNPGWRPQSYFTQSELFGICMMLTLSITGMFMYFVQRKKNLYS